MNLVNLTATYVDGSGVPITNGRVNFQLSTTAELPSGPSTLGSTPIRCVLNPITGQLMGPTGQPYCPLVPNDASGISPANTFYVVTESLAGGITNFYTITIASTTAPTVDLSTLTRGQVPASWVPSFGGQQIV
jgi:hypothetical protein